MTEDQKEEKQRGTNAKSALKGAFFMFAQHGRTLTSESLECAFVVGNT
jgi:hypothetical protein